MPDLPTQDIRLPEFHLPEIKREDIVRSLSGIHMPEVDLSKVERPKIDLSSIDLGKAVAGAAAAAHIGRQQRRSRWPFALGAVIVVGLAGWAIMSSQTLRSRLSSGASAVRERLSAMAPSDDRLDIDRDDTIAFDAAETAPIEPGPYADASTGDGMAGTSYPDGLGNGNGHGHDEIPAFEESARPV
jgi:hypothetical protein